jgi:Tfp pilus assembly protein PilX
MKRTKEKGAALIFAMVLVLVLSVMAASLMFISQSETWSSLNYRLMTQSRYGAEAGLHAAANYLMYNYPVAGTVATDPIGNYATNVSPVTYGGNPVVLGVTMNGISANYPVSTVVTNFGTQSAGTLTSGNNNVNYTVQAELLSMKQFQFCGNATGQPLTGQVWKLTSHGDINAARTSEVEVSALLELHVNPCYTYAGFATGNGCGSIQFSGGGTVNSYDSGNLTLDSNGNPVVQAYDGSLGSNGNLNAAPNTTVNGIFASPDTGVGNCSAGQPDAISGNTTAVTGCMTSTTNCGAPLVSLHAQQNYPPPVTDYPTCSGPGVNGCDTSTAVALNQINPGSQLTPGNYGDLSYAGQTKLTLFPSAGANSPATCGIGVYYINSIGLSGKASLTVAPCPGTGGNTGFPAVYQPVIINIVGAPNVSTPLDIGGNGIANPGFNSALIQFNYAGTGEISLHGNGATSAVIYAPNSGRNCTPGPNCGVVLSGNGTIYGSVIGNKIYGNGVPISLNYDRQLANNLKVAGNWTLDTFTWSKF